MSQCPKTRATTMSREVEVEQICQRKTVRKRQEDRPNRRGPKRHTGREPAAPRAILGECVSIIKSSSYFGGFVRGKCRNGHNCYGWPSRRTTGPGCFAVRLALTHSFIGRPFVRPVGPIHRSPSSTPPSKITNSSTCPQDCETT